MIAQVLRSVCMLSHATGRFAVNFARRKNNAFRKTLRTLNFIKISETVKTVGFVVFGILL